MFYIHNHHLCSLRYATPTADGRTSAALTSKQLALLMVTNNVFWGGAAGSLAVCHDRSHSAILFRRTPRDLDLRTAPIDFA
jgi:hypothetical protein